jgi:hypothetical protein
MSGRTPSQLARRLLPRVLAALAAVGAARFVAGDAWARGFPLDDAWIHMVYGLALRTEGTLAYNDGHAATGCTSPLWAVLVGLAHLLTGSREPSMRAALALKVLGVALHALCAWLAVELGARASRRRLDAELGAGMLVALAPVGAFAAVSGMEVPLASALLLSAFTAQAYGRPRLAGALVGLAAITRPEAALLVPLLALSAWYIGPRRGRLRRTAAEVALAAAPSVLVAVRNWRVSGRPLPATFYQKAHAPELARLDLRAQMVLGDMLGELEPYGRAVFAALLVAAVACGALAVRRLGRHRTTSRALAGPLVLGALALAVAAWFAALIPTLGLPLPSMFYYQRYYAPVLPLGAVAAAGALSEVACLTERALLRGALRALSLLLVFVPALGSLPEARASYARAVAQIDEVQVAVARRVGEAPRGAVLWTQDAGAPRYFGRELTVDLCRLNTPELLRTPDVPPALAPDLVLVPPALWQLAGDLDIVVDATPQPFVDRTSRQVLFRCVPGGSVTVSFRGVRIASSPCATRDAQGPHR